MSGNAISRRELLAAAAVSPMAAAQSKSAGPVSMEIAGAYSRDLVVQMRTEERLFAVYNFESHQGHLYKPFFHPVMGPNQKPITQNGEFPGTLLGHYWHRALFVAHQKVNGVSFWEERSDCGRMIHQGFDNIKSGDEGGLDEVLVWRAPGDRDLLREVRTLKVPRAEGGNRILDITIALQPLANEVVFEATPYNLLACRVVDSMAALPLKTQYTQRYQSLVDFSPLDQGGRVVNSEGKQDDDCRGAHAKWCDVSGPLGDGSRGGVAILDHPDNPRHPTAWHNWKNLTITAAFTFHEPFTLRRGQELKLLYRVVVHPGDAKKADVEGIWRHFAKS